MDKDKILRIVADTIEVESVSESLKLNEDIWDSLAIIVFIAALNKEFGLVLNPEKISSAKTVQDLVDIVEEG